MTTTPPQFDYIIVGGGTAGLAVASHLSKDETVRVLVIEAGADHSGDPLVSMPGGLVGQFGNPEYDWNFRTVPQEHLNGRLIPHPRGCGLGGCSSINFMMWLHPSRASLDAWAKLGNPGWGYDDLAPYPHDFSSNGNGPVQVSFSEGYTEPFNQAWMETFANLGHKLTADPRTGKAIGAFQSPASIDPKDHTRSSATTAYLGPKVRQRSSLAVMTDATVKRILFERDDTSGSLVAKGVVVDLQSKDGGVEETTIPVNFEVILSAGALQSPQILELSGIGQKDLLASHGIEVLVDNSGVGERLQDHAISTQCYEVRDDVPSGDTARDPAVLGQLMELYRTTNGDGPLGQSNIATAYMPMVGGDGALVSPSEKKALLDTHLLGTGEGGGRIPSAPLLHRAARRADGPVPPPLNYATVLTCLNHPASRGSVHIVSPDIRDKPTVDPRYMSHPLDLEVMARHVQFVEKIVAAEPLRSSLKPQGARIPPDLVAGSVENAKEIVRRRLISIMHPTGSCAMLPREKGGVVDHELRVYGTRNVRVVDASVFPLQPLGNTQSVVYAVAERAANMIKNGRLVVI
ncbi:aryl-alcohol dehydrogenase [Apiospora saccharicola]|uniref:Aryl-alcohol dehydrogenase n=1 Tax=Apiospora saccharicola TaxID=335842 RepID=A0ABR1UH72_9PEZI